MRYNKINIIFLFNIVFIFVFNNCVIAQNNVKIKGYMKTLYSDREHVNSEMEVLNARIGISGTVNEKTEFYVLFDAVNKDILYDAFITRKINDNLLLHAGQFKTPYSTDNLINSAHYGFINMRYGKDDASPDVRDTGVTLNYDNKYFTAIAGVMNGSGLNRRETNNSKSIVMRTVFKPAQYFNLSGNYYTGKDYPNDDIRKDYINFGINGNIKKWEYYTEYAQKDEDKDNKKAKSFFASIAYDWFIGYKYLNIISPAYRFDHSDTKDFDNNVKKRHTIGLTAHLDKEKYSDSIMINYEIADHKQAGESNYFGVMYCIIL